jgi:hypothetical protein
MSRERNFRAVRKNKLVEVEAVDVVGRAIGRKPTAKKPSAPVKPKQPKKVAKVEVDESSDGAGLQGVISGGESNADVLTA